MGKCYKQLSLNDRLIIEKMLNSKQFTKTEIATTVNCSRQTLYREIQKGTITGIDTLLKPKTFYSSTTAQEITNRNKKKQGAKIKKANNKLLMNYITKKLDVDKYSPKAISVMVKKQKNIFGETISDNIIYKYIKENRFENITMSNLPYAKTYTKKYQKIQKRATLGQSIEERPEYINDRSEFGHWEMDSVEGSKDESIKTMLVLSERKTRKEIMLKNDDQTSKEVVKNIDYLEFVLGKNFNRIFKSITVDNGHEFCDNVGISKSKLYKNKKRTDIYYCHPYTPWERGTNENINKMIRKYIPKGTNFDDKTNEDLKFIQEEINNYPRGIFNYKSANDMFIEELKKLKIKIEDVDFLFH